LSKDLMTIGRIARRTGVSVKALRLYEQRGLLVPSTHSPAGYRLYDAAALRRLQRIVLLRRAGFALSDVGRLLDGAAPEALIRRQIGRLEQELAARAGTLQMLRTTLTQLGDPSSLDLDQLTENIAMTQTLEVDLTAEERAALARQGEQLGADRIAAAQREWPALIAAVRAAIDAGKPTDAPEVQALARRWHELVQTFTGGSAEIGRKVGAAYRGQPAAMAAQGMDLSMFDYVGRAMRAAGLKPD
jgi:DNA-binding transcriptional MerR regulator